MNANAEPLWGYLKIAMACTGALEHLHLVNGETSVRSRLILDCESRGQCRRSA